MSLAVPKPLQSSEVLQSLGTRRYLSQTVRVWLGIADAHTEVPTLPPELARILMRLEEYELSHRDRWGCWDFGSSENFHAGNLWDPEIDRWLVKQRAKLVGKAALEPLWPNGSRFAVCLTHDVDLLSSHYTPRQAGRFARAGLAPGVAGTGERFLRIARPGVRMARSIRSRIATAPSVAETLERSMSAEASRGVTASYFFTAPPAAPHSRYDCVYAPADRCRFRGAKVRVADVMRALAAEGFDVGLHGGYAAALASGALAAQRRTLEAATGLQLTTTRQHFLRWDIRTTPSLQEEARLEVDSSLGFNRNVGFRAGTGLPFHLFDAASGRPLRLLEVPLVVEDTALLADGGLELDDALARRVIGLILDTTAAVGGAVTLLFHPDKFVRPEWLALYEWSIDRALERQAWVTSLRGMGDWWHVREARVLAG
ncbi:MAG: hypothetical protein ABI948_03900 [Thermoleophilia bacterium]